MKYLVNKITEKDLDGFGSDGYIKGSDGNYYSYQVEFGTNPGGMDEVAISDGCNRYVPVAIENVTALIVVLRDCLAMHNELVSAEALKADVESPSLEAYVNSANIEFND